MRGSIKGEPGAYYFVVDVPGPDGKRKQLRRRGFATKKAATAELNDVLAGVQRGTFVQPDRVTVGKYLDGWLAGLESAGRKPSTTSDYRKKVNRHVRPHLGSVELQALTPLHLDHLYAQLRREGKASGGGLSLRTVRYVHSLMHTALASAERKGLVQRNVARLASPPSASSARAPEMTVWTPAELRAFLDGVADHHHGPLFRLTAMTGMRRGEVCGVRWSDVDDANLTVRHTVTTVDNKRVEGVPKTSRSRRTIDLDPRTVEVLRSQRTAQLEQRLLMGAGWTDTGAVFAMPDGQLWHPDVISRAFDRAVARSGLPRIRFHDLRHTHATHLLAAGTNVKVVSDRLGHASTSFTLDTYGHVLPGQGASAASAVAALVDG